MNAPNKFALYAAAVAAATAPAAVVNAEILDRQCEDSDSAICRHLAPAQRHDLEKDVTRNPLGTATYTATGNDTASMPPADAWNHYGTDGYEHDSVNLFE